MNVADRYEENVHGRLCLCRRGSDPVAQKWGRRGCRLPEISWVALVACDNRFRGNLHGDARQGGAAIIIFAAAAVHGPAHAELPADATARFNESYQALRSLMAQRQAQGALPRLSDAADARVLNQFWDDVILGQPPYTANDVPSLQDIAGKGNEFFRIYAAALFDRPAAGAQLDEYIRFQAFLARTEAATVPALTDHWTRLSDEQKDQVRHQGLFIKREGLHRTAASLIKTMLATHVGPANRDYLAGVLAQHALALAAGMTSADRAEIAAMIRQAVRSLPPTRQQALKEVADAMAAMPCEGLCAVR